jgi:hypothetical protein
MSIFPASAVLRDARFFLATFLLSLTLPLVQVNACTCYWRGPFLSVFRDAPLVVRGKVLRHNAGQHPSMDVQVLEILVGGVLDSGLRIQMGDGLHCRPEAKNFPVGSDWILAINGPGSKPGNDLAISYCGEYWLRVDGAEVVGSIDGHQGEVKRLSLSKLSEQMRYPTFQSELRGTVEDGKRFRQSFGPGFEFVLEPSPAGWEIVVREQGRDENLARLTPPLHFAPNPREIEAWHVVDAPPSCPRSYDASTGPPFPREFIFSPEVGRTIAGPQATRSITPEDAMAVQRFGRGKFTIERFEISYDGKGCPHFKSLEFKVRLEGGY